LRNGLEPLPLLIGVFNHATMLCPAAEKRLGPSSNGLDWSAGGASDGVIQYGLPVTNERSAAVFVDCRSGIVPATVSFISVPTCSWDALSVRRTFRANQIPTARKTNSAKRFPSSYQLLCIHAVISLIASPWTGTASSYNPAPLQETGRRSSKWSARYLPSRPIGALAAQPGRRKVGTHEHRGAAAALARVKNPLR